MISVSLNPETLSALSFRPVAEFGMTLRTLDTISWLVLSAASRERSRLVLPDL
jgi:hypothetical protein